jgi:hypothetical protein
VAPAQQTSDGFRGAVPLPGEPSDVPCCPTMHAAEHFRAADTSGPMLELMALTETPAVTAAPADTLTSGLPRVRHAARPLFLIEQTLLI